MEVRDRECESWDSDGKEEMLNNGSPASKDLGRKDDKRKQNGKRRKVGERIFIRTMAELLQCLL
jgi:hypothetical protein